MSKVAMSTPAAGVEILAGQGSLTATAEVIGYPRQLLAQAKTLIDQQHYGMAVVVAHIACEVATERRLAEAFAAKGIGHHLEGAVMKLLNGYNLSHDNNREFYTAFTDNKIQQARWWSDFRASAKRRNGVIHKGATVTRADAKASYNVVDKFLTHLKF
jgi:hypothetical protein